MTVLFYADQDSVLEDSPLEPSCEFQNERGIKTTRVFLVVLWEAWDAANCRTIPVSYLVGGNQILDFDPRADN